MSISYRPGRGSHLIGLAVAILVLTCGTSATATQLFKPDPEAVLGGADAAPWSAIERHVDRHPRFPLEPFHPKLAHFYPQVAKAFATKEPHSRSFLLHLAPGWDRTSRKRPVLLIPGANDDGTRRYAHPLSHTHPDHLKVPGLAQYLAARGFAVFAISFSHYHGCNLHQGEQVANAIARIRALLKRDSDPTFKVDLVTYSKGAMAARCYLQSAGQLYGAKHLTAFRGDVHRVVFQVGPIGGLDTPFRYYLYNLTCKVNEIPAPLGVSSQVIYGSWVDSGAEDIHSGFWTGQLQMIHDQREVGVGYGPLSWTADANLTMVALRDGGASLFLKGQGLDAARHAGGDMIEQLNRGGLPAEVRASLAAGTQPILYDDHVHTWKMPLGAELSGQSDGLVFTKSACYAKGLTGRGARVTAVKTFPLNHIDMSRSAEVFRWVSEQLAAE
ncbi:MAG: hypothetical protein HY815_14485 [Candidatus Riflebacteria bacterium]|nr:hypothetical protein [Candidatus Riflebacteria bacterium]